MKKLSKIMESVWGSMLDRGSGETVRKEDDVNLLDRDGLYDYIFSLYEPIYEFPKPLKGETTSGYEHISIPLFIWFGKFFRLYVSFEGALIDNIFINTSLNHCEEFKDILLERFTVIEDEHKGLIIQDKDGMVTNQLCMDLIQTITENADHPLLKKKD